MFWFLAMLGLWRNRMRRAAIRADRQKERTGMAPILASWLTPKEAHDLVGLAAIGVLALVVRYVGTYALVARCIQHTRPEDRPQVLQAAAEVLRSVRDKRSVRQLLDNENTGEATSPAGPTSAQER
jgi:hypothetical protein